MQATNPIYTLFYEPFVDDDWYIVTISSHKLQMNMILHSFSDKSIVVLA